MGNALGRMAAEQEAIRPGKSGFSVTLSVQGSGLRTLLALTNDTSGWQHLTSDGRLSGHITDDGYSVSGKTITFAGGVSGCTVETAAGSSLSTAAMTLVAVFPSKGKRPKKA